MPRSLAVVGNCQVSGIEKSISLFTSDIVPQSFHMAHVKTSYDGANFVEELRNFDLVYAHASDDPEFGTEALRSGGIKVQEIPVIAFPAFHPDMVYVQQQLIDGTVEILKSPVGDNHSSLVLYGHRLGLEPDQIANLFCSEVYEAVGFLDAWSSAWEGLVAQGARVNFPLESMMLNWSRRGVFMHTLNHPRVFVLADLARAIVKQQGAQIRAGTSDAYISDDLITSTVWPVYPEIAGRMSLEGSLIFKRDQITHFYDLDEMINESVKIYNEVGQDFIQCWRCDLWASLPRIPDLMIKISNR